MSTLKDMLESVMAGQAAALTKEDKWIQLERVDQMRSAEFKEIDAHLNEQVEPHHKARWAEQNEINEIFTEFDEHLGELRERLNKYLEERYRRDTRPLFTEYQRRSNEINTAWRELHARIYTLLSEDGQ